MIANIIKFTLATIRELAGSSIHHMFNEQVGNDQEKEEKAQSERNSHSKNRGGKNLIDN